MAPRRFWRGYLKLSLVTCPVSMTPATTPSGQVRFHTYFDQAGDAKVAPEPMALLTRLIDDRTSPWRPDMVADPVQDALLEIISAKKKKKRHRPADAAVPEKARTDNVVSILDALKRSLAAEKSWRR